ncbi:MAG: hypothetical protein U1F25_12960 [Rubrivivax sp.]
MTKRSNDPSALLTSAEAAAWLGIKRETLYAYVSRGLVKGRLAPTADAGDARGRRENATGARTSSRCARAAPGRPRARCATASRCSTRASRA